MRRLPHFLSALQGFDVISATCSKWRHREGRHLDPTLGLKTGATSRPDAGGSLRCREKTCQNLTEQRPRAALEPQNLDVSRGENALKLEELRDTTPPSPQRVAVSGRRLKTCVK